MKSTNHKSDLTPEQLEARRQNRALKTAEVIERLRAEIPEVLPYAEIAGAWVWIETPDKPEADTRLKLRLLGFSWNHSRCAWQHACGVWRPKSNNDPRAYYGVNRIVGGPVPVVKQEVNRQQETPKQRHNPINVPFQEEFRAV